jgi:hypothetical protein
MARQAEFIGTKRVGFKYLRASLKILLVNRKDEAWVGEVQFVVATIDKDPTGVKNRTHGAIGEHGAAREEIGKLGHPPSMLSHALKDVSDLEVNGAVRRPECARVALSRTRGLLCYTSRVKSYAEPVQDESVFEARVCRKRHSFCPCCG